MKNSVALALLIGVAARAQAAHAAPLTPEEERAAFSLPPGFAIELVAQEDAAAGIGKFAGFEWDQHGRMWAMTALEKPVDGKSDPALAKAQYEKPGRDKVLIFDTPFAPGVQTPRVFADGLTAPRGLLPYQDGCYVQHGPDILFLSCTDAETKKKIEDKETRNTERISILQESALRIGANRMADSREVVFTGFGVQDAQATPHQFARMPGGSLWLAQGAGNSGRVRHDDPSENWAVHFGGAHMAEFSPDGSRLGMTTSGPDNLSGLVLTGEGECFIQDARADGSALTEFQLYASYPGGTGERVPSYAPVFPGTPGLAMGGDSLSGLALSDKAAWPKPHADVMYVANPSLGKIHAIKVTPDGPYHRYARLPDFISSGDEWFRPVAIRFGPDGCLYIADAYDHAAAPDADHSRGRIWRVKAVAQKPFAVPDFTKLTGDQLLAKLGGSSLAQSHLAWQAIGDRRWDDRDDPMDKKLEKIVKNKTNSGARRIQALWTLEALELDERGMNGRLWALDFPKLLTDPDRNIRRELARLHQHNAYTAVEIADTLAPLVRDPDPDVKAALIRTLGTQFINWALNDSDGGGAERAQPAFEALMKLDLTPLAAPTAVSTQNAKKIIKVREAYDREFERYLVRMFLEDRPKAVISYLDSPVAKKLPIERRLFAALALEPRLSAARVARLLPKLTRPPTPEEVLRLAEFPDEPGAGDVLCATLQNPATRAGTLDALLAGRGKFDVAKLTPFLADAAAKLRVRKDNASRDLARKITADFALPAAEPALLALAAGGLPDALPALRALAAIGSRRSDVFAQLATASPETAIRDAALDALLAARADDVPPRALALYPKLTPGQRRTVFAKLSGKKSGAVAILAAIKTGTLPAADLDPATLDRLRAVLGPDEPTLAQLVESRGALFRPVLMLNGADEALAETIVDLEGPFTVETWVRLDPASAGRKTMGNADSIVATSKQFDMNFHEGRLHVWAGAEVGDAIVSKKPMTPGLWTHLAVTRNAEGFFKIYQDGELAADESKAAPQNLGKAFVAASGAAGGTAGAMAEFRIWDHERTADEIRAECDRRLPWNSAPGLVFTAFAPDEWGKLYDGAKVVKTSDFPPVLSADEAAAVDAKYEKFRLPANQPGDAARGKFVVAVCQTCHVMDSVGGNFGPKLSGVAAMDTERLLRKFIQPSAAMESSYRTYRVELKNGDVVDALWVSEDQDTVTVRTPGAEDRRIPRAEIRDAKFLRRSLMPEGLLDTLRDGQVRDLFAYLQTLK